MKLRVAVICSLLLAVTVSCGKKATVTNPALEKTAVLYPFEPIPLPAYEGMGLAKHSDLRIAQEMARVQAMTDLGSNIFETVSARVNEVVNSRELSQNLVDKPIREALTKQIAGAGAVNADVQSLALFYEQQMTKARADSNALRNRR
jgi:hypothetical protein